MTCASAADEAKPLQAIVDNVDCHVRGFAQLGYSALSQNSLFSAALTALLTVYVAVIGYRLLLGNGPRLSDTPIMAIKLGAILAFSLQWPLFQTVIFDVAADGGRQVSSLISQRAFGNDPNSVETVDGVYRTLLSAASDYDAQALLNPALQPAYEPGVGARLRGAAKLLLFSTAGIQSIALVLSGILTALGPIFVALAMFDQTRGMFLGWLRSLAITLLLPLIDNLGSGLMLQISQPSMQQLGVAVQYSRYQTGAADAVVTMIQILTIAQGGLMALTLVISMGIELGRDGGRARRRSATVENGLPARHQIGEDWFTDSRSAANDFGRRAIEYAEHSPGDVRRQGVELSERSGASGPAVNQLISQSEVAAQRRQQPGTLR